MADDRVRCENRYRGRIIAVAALALVACDDVSAPGDDVSAPGADTVTPVGAPPAAQRGLLVVSNATTGGAFDPDGFVVTIEGGRTATMELNDEVTFDDLAEANYTAVLGGVASNCSVSGGLTRPIGVRPGETARVTFAVVCQPTPELAAIRIVFARASGDYGFRAGSAIVAMNADGGDRVPLTSGEFNDYGPDVSPDGRKIAFMRDALAAPYLDSEIHVMNADGTGLTRVREGVSYDPDWSPDGSRIVFGGLGDHWGGPVLVMSADGRGEVRLTGGTQELAEDAWPAWSPDGTRIAFTRADLSGWGTQTSIWVMGADGTSPRRLSESRIFGGAFPVWSPDGRRIAFGDATGSYPLLASRIRVMNADGSAEASVLEGDAQMLPFDWSADGRTLLVEKRLRSGSSPRSDIYLLHLDDGSVVRLTADGAVNHTPAFWPSVNR